MPEETGSTEPIQLEKPQRGAKDMYLARYSSSCQMFDRIVVESNGIRDHRFRLMVLRQIAMITDDDKRKELMEYFDQKINEIQGKGKDVDTTNQLIADFCCGEMSGHITAWFDEFMGITHRLTIGKV